MMDTFKIIGIRVLEKCAPHIKKVLKENSNYFFQNEYVYDNKIQWVKKREDYKLINENFFSIETDIFNDIKLNISAIVGQNGDGKSSIIELILRILNNFAFASGFNLYHESLVPIKDVWAELFYSINGKVFSIKSEGYKVCLYKEGKIEKELSINAPQKNIQNLKELSHDFFYTFVSNYSLYAYNSLELNKEYTDDNQCWIEKIFHKNDGYQTPIVLNPYRKKGNIDVNIENALSKQRLMAMFVDGSIKEINKDERPKGFAYKLEKRSKLFTKTLRKFMEESQDTLEKMFYDFFRRTSEIPRKDLDYLLECNTTFWKVVDNCIKNNRELFDCALDINREIEENNAHLKISLTRLQLKTSIKEYINYIRANKEFSVKLEEFITNFKKLKYDELSFSTIHRIIIINEIQNLWDEKFHEMGIADCSYYDLSKENSSIAHAKSIGVYKTINILETYIFQYNDSLSVLNLVPINIDGEQQYIDSKQYIRSAFNTLYEDIKDKKSHITLKIRQTLNFLLYNSKYKYIERKYHQNKKLSQLLSDNNYTYYQDFISYKKIINNITSDSKHLKVIELLPPPIYDVEVIIEKEKENALLSMLSSGERQLLNSISGIVYHLRNIDSTLETDNTINYKYVNLMFEEIELYFHPEFQQKYILSLINILSKMEFNRLKAINMCFVTHSPFILSDIPKNNVLFLQEGLPAFPMQEDTFGSNIHTLLHNGFFLSNVPIGAFAQHKINKMFEKLHRGMISDELYNEILLVSEPFLKSQLLKLYKQYKIDSSEEINMLRKEIEELKKRIN